MFENFFIFLVKCYRVVFCLKRPCCRYIPSCSEYAIESIRKYGTWKGIRLTFFRILRCRPGLKKYKNCGYDPVP